MRWRWSWCYRRRRPRRRGGHDVAVGITCLLPTLRRRREENILKARNKAQVVVDNILS